MSTRAMDALQSFDIEVWQPRWEVAAAAVGAVLWLG
jgi:hypothetical protein